jgi:Protein of unknown function (DUF3147)
VILVDVPCERRSLCMWSDLLLRGLIGATIVSAFAIVADVVKPKSFAGLFGAAPSVALATFVLTIRTEGATYTAVESRSMLAAAIAFGLYACIVCRSLVWSRRSVGLVVSLALLAWFGAAFGVWSLWLHENHP